MSLEADQPTQHERELRIRELEATTIAMRDALELAQREADDRLQAAAAQAAGEADQLRTMIAALRDELEAHEQRHGELLQRQKQAAADEVGQLQATIRALRDQLEENATLNDGTSTDAVYAEQLEQLRQLQLLASLSRRVAALDSLDAVIDTLLQAAVQEIAADRGSIFLHDAETGELYTYISTGLGSRQIRLLDDLGIAGSVFHSGIGEIVHDAAADPRFHHDVDEQTGYETRSLVCAPIRNAKGETIGVAEMLNKLDGAFEPADLTLLEGMTSQCAITLEALQRLERTTRDRQREVDFLNLVSDLTSELELTTLLSRVVSEATRMLDCDRTTLFLNDEKTGDLFSYVVDKLEVTELRFPNHVGIAGAAFTSGQSIRIPYAYADLRFNPAFDRQTGYFTRCILCVPIFNKEGRTIGVTQSLNKRGGPFTAEDESRLRAFTAQIASALENAKLFSDVQAMQSYNAAMLESMASGVITFDEEGRAGTCNAAGSRILRRTEEKLVGKAARGGLSGERLAGRADQPCRAGAHDRSRRRCRARGRGADRLGERHDPAAPGERRRAARHARHDRGHLEREARQVDARALHGPRARRPPARGGAGGGGPGRERVRRDRALLRHPQLHVAGGAARRPADGRAPERLLPWEFAPR